jgi:hypothetical protein
MSKNVNWIPIREDFIQRKISQSELAKKYDVQEATIGRKSIKEHWVSQREAFEVESQGRLREQGIEEVASLNKRKLEVGRWLSNLGIKSLRKYEKEDIKDDRIAVEAVKQGFILQSEALGVDNTFTLDLKAMILNVQTPVADLEDFIKWRNDRRKRELEQPITEITGTVSDRVDTPKQIKDGNGQSS